MIDIPQYILDDDDFRLIFCARCPAKYHIYSRRGEYGESLEPDEETCPSDFAIDDPRCVRAKDWAEIRSAAIDLQGLIGEKLVKINS